MNRKSGTLIKFVFLLFLTWGGSVSAQTYDLYTSLCNHLKANVGFPVLVPSYWGSIPQKVPFKYIAIQSDAEPTFYRIIVSLENEPFLLNDSRLKENTEENLWAVISGQKDTDLQPLEEPNSVIKVNVGDTEILAHPSGTEYFWENGNWQCKVRSSSMDALKTLKEVIEATEDVDWLKGLHVKQGNISISYSNIHIEWISQYGNKYSISTQRSISESLQIADSMTIVNDEIYK